MPTLTKTLTSTNLANMDIAVTITNIQTAPLVYEVTAVAGQTTFTQRHTIGTVDGTGPALQLTTLQTTVDGFAQAVADIAALQETYRLLNDQLHEAAQ